MSENDESGEDEMSFMDHLETLRWVILRSVIAIIGVGMVAFAFSGFMFDTILFGPKNGDF